MCEELAKDPYKKLELQMTFPLTSTSSSFTGSHRRLPSSLGKCSTHEKISTVNLIALFPQEVKGLVSAAFKELQKALPGFTVRHEAFYCCCFSFSRCSHHIFLLRRFINDIRRQNGACRQTLRLRPAVQII